jgi:hypothetical protein
MVAPPKNERVVFFLMAGIWAVMAVGSVALMYLHPQPAGFAVKRCLGMGAEIAGIIVALVLQKATSDAEQL